MCPSTLQEAKPKAGSSRVVTVITGRTADGSRSPEVEAELSHDRPLVRIHGQTCLQSAAGHPDENKSGRGRIGANGTWARSDGDVSTTRLWD
jgi:hypothetical protein